ncbi:MAG: hypothetical protein U0793_24770 [Gemmataceae bacterium]
MIANTLLLALFAAQPGPAETKKAGPDAEITFANGSVLRMTLLPDEIAVETQFGKLMVPIREIRRIDFGLHAPEGTAAKVEAAVRRLADPEYKEREAAVRALVALGIYAYPALVQAAKNSDLETSKRAQAALAQIKAKVPAKDLRLTEEDKIVTPRFTIVGRILNPAVKAKSEYFGEAEQSIVKLRLLRLLGEARDAEVVLDAGKYAQPDQWLDTGVVLGANSTLAVQASGELELRPSMPGTYTCGPRGLTRPAGFGGKVGKKGGMDLARSYPGTLLGRIGEKGETFVIGERFENVPEREGRLYLQIVSSPYDTAASGSYQVKIAVRD